MGFKKEVLVEHKEQESTLEVESIKEQASVSNYQSFRFEGSGKEYFRIWIVNIALTILTLGVYSAWAKVRTNRYIYANTYLNGSNFEYNADPVKILIGRIVVVGFYAAFVIFSDYLMMHEVAGAIAFVAFLAMPWLIRQAISFKMRNTSYRNIPFRYTGRTADFYFFFIVHGLLNIFTFFLAFPYSYVKFKKLMIDNAHYGDRGFKFYGTTGESYSTFILVFVWSTLFIMGAFLALFVVGSMMGAIFGGEEMAALSETAEVASSLVVEANSTYISDLNESYIYDINSSMESMEIDTEEVLGAGLVMMFGAMFLIYLPIIEWYRGFSDGYFSNFVRNFTKLGQAPLKGEIKPFKLGVIAATNIVAIILSLGLLYPWAKIRYLRYKLENTSFACHDYEQFESTGYEQGSTVGEEMTDFFDIDIGL